MKQSATLLRDTTERQTITVSKEGWKKVKKKELSSSAVNLDFAPACRPSSVAWMMGSQGGRAAQGWAEGDEIPMPRA
ncbi:hypothetical protein M9458_014900, partial [Cirrhinus mrigala]